MFVFLFFLTLTAAALVSNGWIIGVRVLLLFLLLLLLFDVSTKILVLFPHLSHSKQLEVGLGSLVLWEDVVEVLLPALITTVLCLHPPPFLHSSGKQLLDLSLRFFIAALPLKISPSLQKHQAFFLFS